MNKFIVKDKILNWKNRNFVSQKYSTFESRIVVRIKQTKTSKTEKLLTRTRVKKIAAGANEELVRQKWFSFGKRNQVKRARMVLVTHKDSCGNQRTRAITGLGLPEIRAAGCSLFNMALGP